MRITTYLVLIFLIFSCKPEIKKEKENAIILNILDTVENKFKSSEDKLKKTHLDKLLENGLVIADSTEKCGENILEFTPKLNLVVNFENNQKIIISEIEYGIENNELNLFDFSIIDCDKDSILFQSNYTISNYKLVDVKPETILEISSNNIDSVETILGKIIFFEDNGNIKMRSEISYNPKPLTQNLKDSIINILSNNPKVNQLEELFPYLFDASINNDSEMKNIFFSIPDNYILDGGLAEEYYEYKRVLKELGIR